MKKTYLIIAVLFSLFVNAQNNKVINWIDEKAIEIENANPDTQLLIFNDNVPEKFAGAKIFGFGETTHHGKEFFDIKAKFFKYLVKTLNVKVFIIEDSYPSEAGINEWIRGGKGNAETIAKNFSIAPWYCKEVVNLLEWMRNYNLNKSKDEQIRFYGMDIQNVKNINIQIRDLVKKHTIPVSEESLLIVDKCTEKKVEYRKSNNWADIQIPKLNKIHSILIDFQKRNEYENNANFNSTIRALQYLIKYTYYVQNTYSQDRDLKMFENVKWIVENESKNGKAFIWAHNEHINNKGFGNYNKRRILNLGKHLKEHYKNDYYSVGFDFGVGVLPGILVKKGRPMSWKNYKINYPFRKTYAETLFKSKKDIYFIDMENVLNSNARTFFSTKKMQLINGGPGYNPKKNQLYKKKYSEMYDGLIFVKSISVPNYNLKEK